MSDVTDDKETHAVALSDDAHDNELNFNPSQQRSIIHRIDRRLIVMLGFLHMVSLIDRGNIGTAAVAGMTRELRLIGSRYVGSYLGILETKGIAY